MSTIVAVKKNNQVVIGADTQVTWGKTKKSFTDTKYSKLIRYKDIGVFGIVGLTAFDIPFKLFLQDYNLETVNKANLFELLCKFLEFAKTKHLIKSSDEQAEFFAAYDFLFATKDKIYLIN
jgi:ATP-dependent protease HslVU (ClpYQ) peptidase subunit